MKAWMKQGMMIGLLLTIVLPLSAQKLAVKTNLIYDLTTTLNLGVEYRLAPKWTFDLSGNYNPFSFSDNKKWKHWLVQPEARYWFSEAFNRHFVGAHLLGGVFNAGNINAPSFLSIFPTGKDYRYEGEMFGAGLTYGYHHALSSRWSLEYALGLGWVHSDYDKYDCPHCGDHLKADKKDFLGVTKAAISLVYTINRPKKTPKQVVENVGTRHGVSADDDKMMTNVVQYPLRTTCSSPLQRDSIGKDSTTLPLQGGVPEGGGGIKETNVGTRHGVSENQDSVEIIRHEAYTGDILFAFGSHRISHELGGNAASLEGLLAELKKVLADEHITLEAIEVTGYASPEGRAGYNQQLSEERAQAFADYLVSQLPDIDPQLIRAEGRGEDWESFARMLEEQPIEGIDALMQQAKADPEQIDRIESRIRRKAGPARIKKYYQPLRRIEVNVRMMIEHRDTEAQRMIFLR